MPPLPPQNANPPLEVLIKGFLVSIGDGPCTLIYLIGESLIFGVGGKGSLGFLVPPQHQQSLDGVLSGHR